MLSVSGVRILDTCSKPDEAVKAAMRALVASDQTCLHPPLFLGECVSCGTGRQDGVEARQGPRQ